MIELMLHELKPGMQLAKTVLRPDGTILLRQGFALTEDLIPKLVEFANRFWIIEPGLEHIIPEDLIEDTILGEALIALRNNYTFFRKKIKSPTSLPSPPITMTKLLGEPSIYNGVLLLDQIQKATKLLVLAFRNKKLPYLLHLNTMRTAGDAPFQKALDIATTSIALGKVFQLTEEELYDMVMGIFLMDVGMWILPQELVGTTRRLNFIEFSAIKEHPALGFEILRASGQISLVCAHVAFQHHERQDGGGFPRRLIGTNSSPSKNDNRDKRHIHRYAEIAAVADTFVELYRPLSGMISRSPLDVIKMLLRGSGTHSNSTIIDALIPLIPLYAVGNRVDIVASPIESLIGGSAVISKTNPERQDRPEITLLTDNRGKWIEHQIIDLAESRDYTIQLASVGTQNPEPIDSGFQ